MNKLLKYGLLTIIVIGVFYLLTWTIAGFPTASKDSVINRVSSYFDSNNRELENILSRVKDIKTNFPDQAIKIRSYSKQLEAKLAVEDEFNGKKYFNPINFQLSLGLHSDLQRLNIVAVIVRNQSVKILLNNSPSTKSDIYLINKKTGFSTEDKIEIINRNFSEDTWIHSLNNEWIIFAKAY